MNELLRRQRERLKQRMLKIWSGWFPSEEVVEPEPEPEPIELPDDEFGY